MSTKRLFLGLSLLLFFGLILFPGCDPKNTISSYHQDRIEISGGHIQREHAKPGGDEYYTNFDHLAVSVEVFPVEDTNPVKTQHVLVATVKDAEGNPLPSRRVEWMITDGVGTIVEVDESGFFDHRGHKIDNRYAVTHTNSNDHVLTRGTEDPSDDVQLLPGQTWCVITSPIEGSTYMAIYAPSIFNWENHKVFAVKHWLDINWQWPGDATNPVNTPHGAQVRVVRGSDGTPIAGMQVNFRVASGPRAILVPGNSDSVSVKTDGSGIARVTLKQVAPVEGANVIEMELVRPAAAGVPAMRIATGSFTKTWIAPQIKITKDGPPTTVVGDTFTYQIAVTNPGKADATNVVVTDPLPAGLQFVSARPTAAVSGQKLSWKLGTLAPQASRSLSVDVKSTRAGTFENWAHVNADLGLSDKDNAVTVASVPALALDMTGPSEVLFCETIPYRVVVRNTGDAPAENVEISEKLPAGLMTEDGQTAVAFDAGTLAPGEAKEASYVLKASKAGTFAKTATATGARGLKASAKHSVTVKRPQLTMTMTGPAERFVDRNGSYDITIANKGDGEARDAVLVYTMPSGAEYVSASAGGLQEAGRVTWNLGTIAPGATSKASVKLHFVEKAKMVSSASVKALCSSATADAATVVKGIPAILLEVVDLEDPIEVGNSLTYEITVTNQGSAVGTNIKIVCTLPPEQQYVSSDGPTRGTSAGQKVTFAPLPSLAPKDKAVFKLTVKGLKPGDVRFAVEMTSDQLKTPVNETESTNLYK